jgi:large subunit ribosomal protein L10
MTDTTAPPAARPDKVAAVAEMTAAFRDSSAALLTEYRGLTMAQISSLRQALGHETTYAVVKNTLTRRAAADAGLTLDDGIFTGPTAIAFVGGDPVAAAKGVRDFSRTNPLLVIKGAVLDGKFLSADDVRKLADLESREVLLARLAGGMSASLSRAAALFQAPLAQVARLAAALQEKKAAEGPADAPAAAPADAAPTDTAPTETDTPSEPAQS